MNQETQAKLEKISSALWDRTKEDWVLTLDHCLTEPTCPTATIRCENREAGWSYWRADRDTIEEAIEAVIELSHAGLFRKFEGLGVPWSEPTLKPVPAE